MPFVDRNVEDEGVDVRIMSMSAEDGAGAGESVRQSGQSADVLLAFGRW
jgi:hypothetical protein